MPILFYNNASTTVSGSITSTDTTVALAAGTGVLFSPPPDNAAGEYFVATFYDQATKTVNEIVHVTQIVGDVATIVRGQEGTDPKPWTAGDIFANLVTAGTLEAFVQTTGPAADTSIVYVGVDTSTTPGIIIANTVPVPANFAVGMLFNIKVANTNDGRVNSRNGVRGAVTLELNGKPYVVAKMTDGHDFIGAEMAAGHEFIFIYDGVTFSTQLVNAPRNPPQNVFYVRADSLSTLDMATGLETATGFANTPQEAFKSIQGAANTIKSRYISQQTLTIRVADGTFVGDGLFEASQYIAGWNLIGNGANPQNVIIDARSTNQATFIPGTPVGSCVGAGANGKIYVEGFTFLSFRANVGAGGGGAVEMKDCHLNAPTSGASSIGAIGVGNNGTIFVWGERMSYTGGPTVPCVIFCGNGSCGWGSVDNTYPANTKHCTWTINGTPAVVQGVAEVLWNGVCEFNYCSFVGGPFTGRPYSVGYGGGFAYGAGQTAIPATENGYVDSSTGGWTQG